jgi:N-acetylmuramoyl-L-alanine amidase
VLLFLFPKIDIAQESTANEPIVKTIVLDAGHGGKDPGNLGTKRYKTTEKDIALDVTLLVGEYLDNAFPYIKVLYTRDDDSFPELKERTEFANSNHADLFVSIHCNANDNKSAHGSDTWVMGTHKNAANLKVAQKENASILLEENYEQNYSGFDPSSPESYLALGLRQNAHLNESLMLAKNVQDEFRTRVGRVDRGVKQSGFWVISFTTMPSILIEMGFLTNPKEEDFLNSSQGKDYMASAIYRAIKKYIISIEGVPISTFTTENTRIEKEDTLAEKAIILTPNEEIEEDSIDLNFRIQLFVSANDLELKASNFNNLDPTSKIKSNKFYKYYFGRVKTYNEAKELNKRAKKNGYDESFIVSFKGDNKIDMQEALTLEQKTKKK